MGPNLLNAAQLAHWFRAVPGRPPMRVPSLHNDITALAQTFIDEGHVEGVRGDIAFVQSILETGWFSFAGFADSARREQLRGHERLRRPRGLAELQARRDVARSEPMLRDRGVGVLTQIQLLRSYADATTKNPAAPLDRRRRPIGSAPHRSGSTSAGATARAASSSGRARRTTGSASCSCTREALVFNGVNAACVPYAPGNNAHNSGNGYWMATDQSHVYTFGSTQFYGDASSQHLNQAVDRWRSDLEGHRLLAARPRRRDLHVRRAPSSTARPADDI